MSRHEPPSWDRAVFDRIYAGAGDPWDFEGSAYERAKYDATLAALPRPRFAACLEVGCSIGVQTRRLAERCDHVLGIDVAAEAINRARTRCADLSNVELRQAQVPAEWPQGTFDLIVLSEVLYFLSRKDITAVAKHILATIRPNAAILLVNWTGETNTPTHGQDAANHLIAATTPHLKVTRHHQQKTYRLDRLEPPC